MGSGHAPGGEYPFGQRAGQKLSPLVGVGQPSARLVEQAVGRTPAAGDDDQIAGESGGLGRVRQAGGVQRGQCQGADALPAVGPQRRVTPQGGHVGGQRPTLRRGCAPQIGHGGHGDAGGQQIGGHRPAVLVGGNDDRPRPRRHAIEANETLRRAAEHDAGQVVIAEQQRLLVGSGGVDDRPGADLIEQFAVVADRRGDGGQPVLLERAQDGGVGQHSHAGVGGDSFDEALQRRTVVVGAVAQMAAQGRVLVDEQDAQPLFGRGAGGGQPGRPAADHSYVGVQVLLRVVNRRHIGINRPQSGGAAQHLLVSRPQRRRVDERLVVEADGQEAVGQANQGHHVPLQRWPGVLRADGHIRLDGPGAGAHARLRADLHQAVGAVAGAAQQTARPVVLERAAEDAHTGRGQGRGDGIAGVGGVALAVKGEGDGAVAVNELAWLGGEAGGHGVVISWQLLVVS